MSKYTIKNVSEDLAFLMTLTRIFSVDEQGFWFDTLRDERFKYQIDSNDTPREIVNFQDPFPKGDFLFFNPFAEGLGGQSPADQFFYRTARATLNSNVRLVVMHVIDSVLAHKADPKAELDHTIIRMASVPVEKRTIVSDVIDEKLRDEFVKIFDRTNENFLSVAYYQPQQTAKLICDVFKDPQWNEKYGTDIRKKSLLALRALLLGVFGIENEKDFSVFDTKHDPSVKTAVRLHTTLDTYLKIYSRFNDVLNETVAINLGELSNVIERLPMAYAIAKHVIQPSLPRNNTNDVSPADTSRLSGGWDQSGQRKFANTTAMSTDTGLRPMSQMRDMRGGSTSRFAQRPMSHAAIDPTAPLVNGPAAGGFSGGMMGFGSNFRGSSFGGSGPSLGGMGVFSRGPDISPPSNFMQPSAGPRFFGRP